MTRWTIVALILEIFLLVSVAIGVIWTGQRDRAQLAERFAQERLQQIDELASEIEEDFSDIGEDLRFAGQLIQAADSGSDRERELRALLAVVKQYRLIEVYNSEAQPTLSVLDPVPGPVFSKDALAPSISKTVQNALALEPGRIETSASLGGDPIGWLRVFATALPARTLEGNSRAVAILVDTQSFFNKLRIVTSKVVLLGAHGRPLPATDADLAKEILSPEASRLPKMTSLLEHMRLGERGTLRFTEEESLALGLGRAEFVAAYTPIEVKDGGHWSTATFNSTEVLRSQEQAIMFRLGVAALVILLCLVVFCVYLVINAKRAIVVQERLKNAEQLAYLHEKTEKILDNIPTGVMALSAERNITAINQALQKKIPKAALNTSLEAALEGVPASTIARLRALLDGALADGRVRSLFGERLVLDSAEGQYNLHAVPLEARFPEAMVLLVIEDVSELRALESHLLRAEKLATVGILAAGIAHEIGTPLSVVRGRAEYVLSRIREHAQAPNMSIIIEQIDHVSRIIRQLLDFSRIQPALVLSVPLVPVIDNVIELLRIEAKRRKIELSRKISDDLPPLAANQDQLQQVLVNLVMNACDACSEYGKITISASMSGEAHIKIEVADNGCGIAPEHRHQIFDPFFTTKKRGQGTGLGLTIAAQIIRNHSSELEIESTPGHGTRATLRWPIQRQHQEPNEK